MEFCAEGKVNMYSMCSWCLGTGHKCATNYCSHTVCHGPNSAHGSGMQTCHTPSHFLLPQHVFSNVPGMRRVGTLPCPEAQSPEPQPSQQWQVPCPGISPAGCRQAASGLQCSPPGPSGSPGCSPCRPQSLCCPADTLVATRRLLKHSPFGMHRTKERSNEEVR